MMIQFILSIFYATNACQFYDNEEYWSNIVPGTENSNLNNIAFLQQQGIGFWLNYQPNQQKISGNNQQYPKNYFLLVLQNIDSSNFSILIYLSFDKIQQTISYVAEFQGQNSIRIQADINDFEGYWNLLFLYVDNISGFFELGIYNSNSNQVTKRQNQGFLQLSDSLNYLITGEYYYTSGGNSIHFNPFLGQIGPLFNTQSVNIIESFNQYISDCPIIYNCPDYSQKLVYFNTYFDSKIKSLISTFYPLQKMGYSVSGWIKMAKMSNKQSLDTTILRITNSRQYQNQQKLGDRLLIIMYHQNQITSLNGFTLQSNSYTFPEPEDSYQTKNSDFINVYGQEYNVALQSWHYFQYEQYTNNNNGQPLYKVDFPSINQVLELKWSQPINQFSNTYRYFSIGSDDYSNTYFTGYMSDWIFTLYCQKIDLQFQPNCHYSCQTCNGITQNDCLTCNEDYHRIYSPEEKLCECAFGYLQQLENGKCLELTEYSLAFSITEIEITCSKEGYFVCDENNILCDYGYFKVKNQCLQCPFFEQKNEFIIKCGDCILYPELFSDSLQCTYDFTTIENTPQSPYVHWPRILDNYDQFILKQDLQHNYYIELMIGYLTQSSCKYNHFQDENGNCSPCSEGCLGCYSQKYCYQCTGGYNIGDNQSCQKCKMCFACFLTDGVETCLYEDNCLSNQYWTGTGCYDCGENCIRCSEQECLKCRDDKNYFLTFDRQNCNYCSIKDCQICFQYFYFEDQLYTTFDYFNKFDSSSYQIQLGCALCKQNMFFNFLTQTCEPQTNDYQYCTFGVIDIQQNILCIKSIQPLLGIQQVSCDQIQNCQECIIDYQNTNDFCIVCQDGYYSTILTGQCMPCPQNCIICQQFGQSFPYYDFWSIKAFYKYFVNQDGTHPFEDYAYPDQNFETKCLDCEAGFIIMDNECQPTCNQNCGDCRVAQQQSSYKQISCFQCKNTIYGPVRSINNTDYSFSDNYDECSKCSELCEACVFRPLSETALTNPFFNQSNLWHYASLCFSVRDATTQSENKIQYSNQILLQPRLKQPLRCSQYEKCSKTFNQQLKVFCNPDHYSEALSLDQRPNSNYIYFSYYQATVYGISLLNTDQLFQFLNQQLIEVVNINFNIFNREFDSIPCQQWMGISTKIVNKFQSQVFSINEVNLNFIGNSGENRILQIDVENSFQISNFTFIKIDQINFYISRVDPFTLRQEFNTGFNIINPYQPITFHFLNSILSMTTEKIIFQLQFNCSNTKNILIENTQLIALNLTKSILFNFQLQNSIIQASYKVKNLTVNNLNLTQSSIFYFDATQFSQQYDIQMIDVTILNSVFQAKSQFINSSYLIQYDIGKVTLTNFYFENITLKDTSKMFNLLSTKFCQIQNFTLKNVTLYDKSSFALLNIINIQDMFIIELQVYQGVIISNEGTKSQTAEAIINSRVFNIDNLQFIRITYRDMGGFLKISQNYESNLNLQITRLFLEDNRYFYAQQGIYSQNYLSFDQSLIYVDCTTCVFQQIKMIRGIGLPEIIIQNSNSFTIQDFQIQQTQKYIEKVLHSTIDCIKPFLYLDIIYALYFGTYHEVILDQISIENSIVFDSPFIIFGSANVVSAIQQNLISIKNSNFLSNMLLITKQNKYTAIIAISTEQGIDITVENCNFTSNFLNEYYKDQQLYSSSTILVNAQLGNILINNCEFAQNTVTNSSDSNLFIKSKLLQVSNTNFFQQNNLKQEIFLKYLYLIKQQNEVTQLVLDNFLILSQGGNGYFVINQLSITNVTAINSQALNGGAFYIITQQEGNILIENSTFLNTSTVFNGYQLSSGGCFYIDSSKSRLSLVITDSNFQNINSRTFGGLIFIEPSHQDNQINLKYLLIKEVFSIQHSILSFSPSRLSSVTSNIYISDCFISNSQTSFDSFLSKLEDISTQDIEPFQRENSAIYAQYSNITISNCSFRSYHIAFLLEVYQGQNIQLENLLISNCTIFLTPIFRLSLRESITGHTIIQNVIISNVSQFSPKIISQCNYLSSSANKDLKCPEDYLQSATNIKFAELSNNSIDLMVCNQQLLYEDNNYNFSIFEIQNVYNKHFYYISELEFINVSCSKCYFGLLNFMEFKLAETQIFFQNMKMQNNYCGTIGCLSLLKTSNIYIDDSINRQLEQKNELIQQIGNQTVQVEFINSVFINNTAHYGAACYFLEVNILIKQCQFTNNVALQNGGAIYYESTSNNLLLIETSITNNYAKIAGGLRITSLPIQVYQKTGVYLIDNFALFQANNSFTVAQHIEVIFQNTLLNKVNILQNKTSMIDEIDIKPYYYLGSKIPTNTLLLPSGIKLSKYKYFDVAQNTYLNYNLSLRLKAFNELFEWMQDLNGSFCSISAAPVNVSNLQQKLEQINSDQSTQFISQSEVYFNSTSLDYNLDDLVVYFDPYNQISTLQLTFYCNQIKIPQYKNKFPYELDYVIDQYYLVLHVKTFPCQLGEYLNETSGGCVQCDVTQNQYSVTKNSYSCSYKDEQKMIAIQSALIQLRNGFWRAYYYSTVIESCYHAEQNCQGGWLTGNPSCALGHIGALCEQCDIYNVVGAGQFSISQQYSCSSCNEVAKNIINIILVCLWTLLSVSLSVSSTVWMIEDFIFQLKLRSLYSLYMMRSTSTSVLLKVFTNYLQIISSITSFQLSIPSGITLVVKGVGTPMDSMQFSLDCFLANMTSIPIIYFRLIFSLLTIGMYILLFYIIYLVNLLIKRSKKVSITFVTTTFIYIYIYLFPNIISGLVGLLSYRIISQEYWIAGNVSYLYNTDQHKIWLASFVIPAFSVFGLLIPFQFWFLVYYNRKKLNNPKTRKLWGYLYNEYKLETYYWETIKILQKELIIIVLLYYADYVAIKASLVFVILYIYSHLTQKQKPYQTVDLNMIDSQSTSICSISIVLASSIYTAQSFNLLEVVYPFYSILFILNFYFVINIIMKLLLAYFGKIEQNFDNIKIKIYSQFPTLINSSKSLKRFFTNTSKKNILIKQRFRMLKDYLLLQARQIIEFKISNNIDIASPKITRRSEQTVITEPLSSTNRYTTKLMRQHTRVGSKLLSNFSIQKIQESKQE